MMETAIQWFAWFGLISAVVLTLLLIVCIALKLADRGLARLMNAHAMLYVAVFYVKLRTSSAGMTKEAAANELLRAYHAMRLMSRDVADEFDLQYAKKISSRPTPQHSPEKLDALIESVRRS
jgi:hypothetical protein